MKVQILLVGALSLGGILACGQRLTEDEADSARAAKAEVEQRRCKSQRPRDLTPESVAVQCAESFVAWNGYTDQVVRDTASVALETVDFARSWADRLAQRRGRVGRAAVLCHGVKARGLQGAAGFTVGFAAPGQANPQYMTAVTMDTLYENMRVEHMPLEAADVESDTTACQPLIVGRGGQ